jgi:flagellar motor switch protein FliN
LIHYKKDYKAMSDASLEETLNVQEQGLLTEFATIIAGAGKNALDNMLGDTFDVSTPDFKLIENYTPEPEETSQVLVSLSMSTGTSTGNIPLIFLMEALTAGNLANVLMGMPTSNSVTEVTDIQLSATGEIVSQMMGVAGNHLSQLLGASVSFSTPEALVYSEDVLNQQSPGMQLGGSVQIQYTLTPGSESSPFKQGIRLIQLLTQNDTTTLLNQLSQAQGENEKDSDSAGEASSYEENASSNRPSIDPPPSVQSGVGPQVTVQPVQFGALDGLGQVLGELNQNLGLVQDILLNMTVELGRSEITIREVLELTRGSVIELDRLAGEPVDLLANGKLIAKGEIVVIEDNFGFRVTSIVSPTERMSAI